MALIRTELDLDHFDKALEAADALAKAQPDNAAVHDLKGMAYVGKKDVTAGARRLRQGPEAAAILLPGRRQPGPARPARRKAGRGRCTLQGFLDKNPTSVDAMTALATMAAAENQTRRKPRTGWTRRPRSIRPR